MPRMLNIPIPDNATLDVNAMIMIHLVDGKGNMLTIRAAGMEERQVAKFLVDSMIDIIFNQLPSKSPIVVPSGAVTPLKVVQ